MAKFDFGVVTAESPQIWAQDVREYYDQQVEEGVSLVALTDSHIWSIPGGNYEAELAGKGLELVSEMRDGRHLVWLDPVILDNRGEIL